MARLEWRPIVAQDTGESALRAQQMSGAALQQALGGFSGVLDQYEAQRREANLAELYARQNEYAADNDVAGYSGALADGQLTRGLNFLRSGDVAAARGFTNDLRTGRNAEFSFGRQQIGAEREDTTYARNERDRETGLVVAREANAIRNALANKQITQEEANTRMAALAEQTQNASQINDVFSAGRSGVSDARTNENWDRDTWRYGNEQENRQWTVEDRNNERDAEALALKFQEFGPNATNEDMMASDAYKTANPRVRARALALLGREAPSAPVGSFSGPADMQQHHTDVASVLSGGGLPSHVVAGFLGNFEVEGGYGGALGDSGTASGIAQWRGGRRTAFQQRFGKEPHQATAAEQAQFVLWELNTPEGRRVAGITEAQANSIKNAPNARVAAERIDQFYERSNGQHRSRRVEAAERFSAPTPQQLQGAGNEVSVTATVAQNTDRNNWLARNVIPLMSDRRDNMTIANELTGTEGKFKGLNAGQVARRIRSVQDTYRRETGGRGELSAAAAGQILANNMDPYTVGDFFQGFTGQRGNIGRGLFDFNQSIDMAGLRSDLAQLRPTERRGQDGRPLRNADGSVQTHIPLATHYTNDQNLSAVAAGGQQGAAAVAQAKAVLDAAVLRDQQTGQVNNPVTARLRREYLALNQQFSQGFLPGAVDTLQAAGQFSAPAPQERVPVRTGPSISFERALK